MKNTILTGICLVILVGCDDLGRAISSDRLEIVEANGETFVIDNSTGSVSIVSGEQLRPLELASSEIFEFSLDIALDNSVIDFDFVFSDSQVYWSGEIAPNPDSQQFESDEEYDLFMDQWFDNIRQSGNRLTFSLEAITSGISFAEVEIELSELRIRSNSGEEQVAWSGAGRKLVSVDYELIESLGGYDAVFLHPKYVLNIDN